MSETAGRGVRANRVREQAAVGRVGSGEIVVEPPALDDGAGLGKEKASGLAALPERRCWRSCPPRDDGHDRFAVKRPKKRLICGQARLPGVSVSQVSGARVQFAPQTLGKVRATGEWHTKVDWSAVDRTKSLRALARELGCSVPTVRRYLALTAPKV